jgi:hypothetical protein
MFQSASAIFLCQGKQSVAFSVCLRLNISLRTLQTLRTTGRLPYTQINRKMFYKPEDVENLIVNPIKDKVHE